MNFIWSIDSDVLRDLYALGKCHDGVLPLTVLRRLDAVLGPTKKVGESEDLLLAARASQMLLLANMLWKLGQGPKLGSRLAEVHDGTSLFTADAGQGKSNILRWIVENDWVEAIVTLTLNMLRPFGDELSQYGAPASGNWLTTLNEPRFGSLCA